MCLLTQIKTFWFSLIKKINHLIILAQEMAWWKGYGIKQDPVILSLHLQLETRRYNADMLGELPQMSTFTPFSFYILIKINWIQTGFLKINAWGNLGGKIHNKQQQQYVYAESLTFLIYL